MTIKAEVLSLETRGDAVRIVAQGTSRTDAFWRPMRRIELDLADHEARRLHIGDSITITVRRKP